MSDEYEDLEAWNAARALGRRGFVEDRVLHFGMAVGAILAAWNTLVGGTMGDYYPARLVLEDLYYFAGSVALTGLGAALEWRALRGRYERRGR